MNAEAQFQATRHRYGGSGIEWCLLVISPSFSHWRKENGLIRWDTAS